MLDHKNLNHKNNLTNFKLKRGFLIAVEGIDGAGKSSLLTILTSLLQAQNLPIILTREPGGTPLGQKLRQILQERDVPVCAKAEYLLFAADRAEHFENIIIPQLALNQIVISDRLADSSLVYQGYGRGLELAKIKFVNQWAMANLQPDLVLYLRLDPATADARLAKRAADLSTDLSSFEKEQRSFTERIAHGFDQIFADRPDVLILDGTLPSAELATQAYDQIIKLVS